MKTLKILSLIVIFILNSCNQLPKKELIESRIQNLKELGTSEYTLKKIIIANDEQWWTIGDKQVIISMKASLKAGIDFSKIKILTIKDKTINIKIPKPKIILLDIKPEDIEYRFSNVSFNRANFTNKELNEIQILGEKKIKEKINDLKILEDAEKNAKSFLTNWLKSIGYKTIKYYTNDDSL